MRQKKMLSFLMSMVLLMSAVPTHVSYAAKDEQKLRRTVYLHARGLDYTGSDNTTTVFKGDITNVYFAVDNPNMGDYIGKDDERNKEIQSKIDEAVKEVVDKYEEEVLTESFAAIDYAAERLTEYYNEADEKKKESLKKKIEKSGYAGYLLKSADEMSADDFDADGKLKIENFFEKFDGNKFNNVFEEVYGAGSNYDYGFEYKYEYEFYYHSKIRTSIKEAEAEIEEYREKITAAESEEDKEALINKLSEKYNTGNLKFISADESFNISFDKDSYSVYIREGIHKDRISVDGEFYVGRNAEEIIRHRKAQYDLNGYTVRIYYDPDFFELADNNKILSYDTPKAYVSENKDETVNQNTQTTPLDDGLWAYQLEKDNVKNDAGYVSVKATIFANGIYFPNEDDPNNEKWYNLCSLPLKPIETGTTQVYIEPAGIDDSKFPLTLYAKHNPEIDEKDFTPTFTTTAVNGGYHTIIIQNKPAPNMPMADPVGGVYKEKVSVNLYGDKDCTIYYRYEGETGEPHRFSYPDPNSDGVIIDEPINIEFTRSFTCWAVRTEGLADGEEDSPPKSNERTYTYKIVPDWPYLYTDGDGDKVRIDEDKYYKDEVFTVYPSTKSDSYSGNMDYDSTGRVVYYTYNDRLTEADVPVSSGTNITEEYNRNPETQWVRMRNDQSFEISKKTVIRMIARKNNVESYSDISEYELGVKPKPVYTVPPYEEGKKHTETQIVQLKTDTEGAIIKYTTDGSDPIISGTVYENPITVPKDVVIRAVAMIPGTDIYSERSRFEYLFESYDDDLIDAFYPRGEYKGSVNVTLTAQEPEYEIEYCTYPGRYDSSYQPQDSDFKAYDNNPITVDRNQTIYARIKYPNGEYGKVYSFDYIIKPLPPVFSQTSTQFTNATEIDVSTAQVDTDINYSLYYTIYRFSEGPLSNDDPTDPNNPNRDTPTDGTDSKNVGIREYTVVKAVVYADYGNGDGEYSEVVTHSYDIVKTKPSQPLTTLVPGYYTRENGDPEEYTTQFLPTPTNTQIYYTISYDGEEIAAPYPGAEGTFLYNPKDPDTKDIPIRGKTIIKAVAINQFGIRSDIGTFTYTVTPEAPAAAPSADINNKDGELPVVPVTAVPGAEVTYTLSDKAGKEQKVVFNAPSDDGEFYINPKDGLPYYDRECTEPIEVKSNEGDTDGFEDTLKLTMSAELDGVVSDKVSYEYNSKNNPKTVAPPYADKEQGTYEEIVQDDKNNVLLVRVYSLNTDPETVIEYRFGNDDDNDTDPNGGWREYPPEGDECIRLKKYTILQLRARIGDNYSKTVSYVYNFKPLPPYFSIPSGTYTEVKGNHIMYDAERRPAEEPATAEDEGAFKYIIMWRYNGAHTTDLEYDRSDGYGGNGSGFDITKTSSVKAYVVNTLTGEKSDTVVNYYVIESNLNQSGVEILDPYNVPRLGVNVLTTGDYAKGIFLELTQAGNGYEIRYKYSYKNRDSDTVYTTNESVFDLTKPIMVTPAMEYITITAEVYDAEGRKISPKALNKTIKFIQHEAPETNLERDPATHGKIVFSKNTEYWVINDYADKKNYILYYTLDGSDPTNKESARYAIKYGDGPESHKHKLTGDVTVKAVYYSSCENEECYYCKNGMYDLCEYPVYGEIGTYRYNVKESQSTGGGGGSSVVNNTRKYTKDIFGYEHPTHISYIKGYPDGSVKADGNITREEMAVILYRIKNKEYDAPFTTTGEVFPDVLKERWSVTEIEYMANDKVVKGYPDGEFKPQDNLTRAEFAALVCRFAKLERENVENLYSDLTAEHWAYEDIQTLTASGLMEGYEDGTFRAENEITRAEVMTVINKLLGRKPLDSYVKSLHYNPYNDLLEEKWYYVIVLEATITHNYYLDNKGFEYKWEDIK